MKISRPVQFAALAAVVAVYLAARFWNITASCLWFDEIFSVHAAQHSWTTILSFVAQDLIHPPLFYILLKVWIGIGGESLFWLRLLPVAFACLAVFPFVLITNEFKLGFWQKLISLMLFAVNGSLIKYAQEVRMYSLLQFLSLTSIWLFVRYFRKGKNLVPLIIVNVLLVYAHYFGWLVVAGEVIAIVFIQRIKIRAILLMLGVTFAAFLPWALTIWLSAIAGAELRQNIGWVPRPGLLQLLQLIFGLFEPFYYQASSFEPVTMLKVSVPVILVIVTAVIIYFVKRSGDETDKTDAVKLLALFVIFPLVTVFPASWILPNSIWGTRHLIIVFAPFCLLIGVMIGSIRVRALIPVIATFLILLSGYAFVLGVGRDEPNHIWCAWKPLAEEAVSKRAENVYVFEDLIAYHFWFAVARNSANPVRVSKIIRMGGVAEKTEYFLPRGFNEVAMVQADEVREPVFWIAYRADRIDESKPPLKPFLDRGYTVADRKVIAASSENAILIRLEKQELMSLPPK